MRIRITLALLMIAALCSPWVEPARPASAAGFTVNSTSDDPDAVPGDGACASTPSGACTLRAAIMEANHQTGAHVVWLPAGRFERTIIAAPEDEGRTGDLDVRANVEVRGESPATTVISAAGRDRVFTVHPGGRLKLVGLTVRDGFVPQPQDHAPSFGGGILNLGTLTLEDVSVADNHVDSFLGTRGSTAFGGGIHNEGALTMERVTVSGNRLTGKNGAGAGIWSGGSMELINVTVSGNEIAVNNLIFGGAGISNVGDGSLTNVTIAANEAGALGRGHSIVNDGTLRLQNTILVRQGGDNCTGRALTSLGHNIENGDTCQLNGPHDLSNRDPLLGPLADNGGPTRTHTVLERSPAIDRGRDAECPNVDQRGFGRPVDGTGDGNASCDIGAFERGASATQNPPSFCSSRPPVRLSVRPVAGVLHVTVRTTAASTLRELRFHRTDNALVDIGPYQGRAGSFTFSEVSGSQQEFVVRRVRPGTATVALDVVDSCGPWPTLVGGGPGAF